LLDQTTSSFFFLTCDSNVFFVGDGEMSYTCALKRANNNRISVAVTNTTAAVTDRDAHMK
jgi:hypothetical protein